MSITLAEVEAKLESAFKQVTEHQGLLSEKLKQIEQLTNDKGTILSFLNQLNGYITAYQDIKRVLSPAAPVAPEEPVASAVEA